MANITIGNYYPEKSILHRLDPRVKLFSTLVWIVMLFLFNNLLSLGILTVYLAAVLKGSRVPFFKLLKGLRGIFFILLFSVVMNLLLIRGTTLVHWGVITISKEGAIRAGYMAVRLIYLVLGTSVLTLTTMPNDLSDGLEKSFGFLKKVKFPVHEIAMVMALALRFIPTLIEEAEKITKAQKARGADFESGNALKRAKNMIPILVPLFVSALRRATELATAMEARCYHGGERTKMKPLQYATRDRFAYGVQAMLVMITVGLLLATNKGVQWVIPFHR
ncbi:MAG: energy-coupling factor transporter transmembrane protein EcfT [Eubacterium sp.]|nr:energy-coupling factor transporter transmembrane protein EcfT [Eubacterium sp.]